jgi:flavin-dependent dehydrogenase
MKHLGTVDLLVIGGGVNGAGIARDAVGRGLSVVLCEKVIWRRARARDRASSSMAACAISSITNSVWCARRSLSARCC